MVDLSIPKVNYTIIKVDNDELLPRFVLKEYSINFYVDEQHTKKYNTVKWTDYFYTEKELRKAKLNEIQKLLKLGCGHNTSTNTL
jgi:hypothetical protein